MIIASQNRVFMTKMIKKIYKERYEGIIEKNKLNREIIYIYKSSNINFKK